ncbi:hypothetical protein [Flavobacterium capsici]|uniref:Uncharacterized protein n=1 Tax=Flavobacterium capsici TaxID=3075618 RepID=A0AA96EYQ1_9FLAO|nr:MULTISPECIES: hypothetical protein [unclassified Flavobacterium]WNM19734.1 hypothetical protein RN608_03395 [Flavobacterium sp. PMR2A8]WNM21123.1 hypothetical protein RN605_10565 [Flavobacterium sp. PMTSA4]
MSFFEEFIVDLGREGIYYSFKWIGVAIKWICYLGKKPIAEIKKENWNRRIGFFVFLLLILAIFLILNKF